MTGLTDMSRSTPATWWRDVNWWLMLLPLAGLGGSVLLSHVDDAWFQTLQGSLEVPAPFMIGFVCVVYLLRSWRQRSALFLLLGVLAFAMALRELHDLPWLGFVKTGVYVALGGVIAWGVLWRDRVWKCLSTDWRHTSWLAATFFAYFLAVVIQRRAFRFIPGEHHIHRSLEECAEFIAHGLFIATCLIASWRRQTEGE
jgi:hypothetical protein